MIRTSVYIYAAPCAPTVSATLTGEATVDHCCCCFCCYAVGCRRQARLKSWRACRRELVASTHSPMAAAASSGAGADGGQRSWTSCALSPHALACAFAPPPTATPSFAPRRQRTRRRRMALCPLPACESACTGTRVGQMLHSETPRLGLYAHTNSKRQRGSTRLEASVGPLTVEGDVELTRVYRPSHKIDAKPTVGLLLSFVAGDASRPKGSVPPPWTTHPEHLSGEIVPYLQPVLTLQGLPRSGARRASPWAQRYLSQCWLQTLQVVGDLSSKREGGREGTGVGVVTIW